MNMLVSRLALAALLSLLAACGSSVKLNDVPVEDKTPVAVSTGTSPLAGTDSGAAKSGKVEPVQLESGKDNAQGPTGVDRVLYFDYDSFTIKPEFTALVEAHARFLKADPKRRVSVEGHTDERGGREYNLALGQKRSEAVRRALVLLGVADAQVEAVSFGKEKPAIVGSDEVAYARNRRAEMAYR